MGNRTDMHQVGWASNKNQAFHQGNMLQKARATTQGAVNERAIMPEVGQGGISAGMFGGRAVYMPNSGSNNRSAVGNPIMNQLDAGRNGGFAQHAQYGPDNNQAYQVTHNPIIAQFQTFNPIGTSPTSTPSGGANSAYGTEQAPVAPAAGGGLGGALANGAAAGLLGGQQGVIEQAVASPNPDRTPDVTDPTNITNIPARGAKAPPSPNPGYFGQVPQGFNRSAIRGVDLGVDNWLYVGNQRKRVSTMSDAELHRYMLSDARNHKFIMPGWKLENNRLIWKPDGTNNLQYTHGLGDALANGAGAGLGGGTLPVGGGGGAPPPAAQPSATNPPLPPPRPQDARAPIPAPPNNGVKGQVPGGFNRSAIKNNALFYPDGKVVRLENIPDAHLKNLFSIEKNRSALAPGWVRMADGSIVWRG